VTYFHRKRGICRAKAGSVKRKQPDNRERGGRHVIPPELITRKRTTEENDVIGAARKRKEKVDSGKKKKGLGGKEIRRTKKGNNGAKGTGALPCSSTQET